MTFLDDRNNKNDDLLRENSKWNIPIQKVLGQTFLVKTALTKRVSTKTFLTKRSQPEFVELVRTKLAVGGCFHMATDWEQYAEHMAEVMNNAEGYTNTATDGDYVPRPDYRPITKFETRGQKLGHGVWDLIYERTK